MRVVWGNGVASIKWQNEKNSRFYDQRIIGYNNYRVRILLDLLKILQMTFLVLFEVLKFYLDC